MLAYVFWHRPRAGVDLETYEDAQRSFQAAVDPIRGDRHDRAASLAAEGWGGIYSLMRGEAEVPAGVEWLDKPRAETAGRFLASLPHESVWRCQLVLGPAPEFCATTVASTARTRI